MITKYFDKPKVIAIVGNKNESKSNLIYYLIKELKSSFNFNLWTYGLRVEIEGARKFNSIQELEQIQNSLIFCDEFFTLFDLEDRKKKCMIENTLRLICHNNNILVLSGLPNNFKKFISAQIDIIFYKKVVYDDFINGSLVKKVATDYKGIETGYTLLNIPKNKVLVYDGNYQLFDVPYLREFDTKAENVEIFVPKIMGKKNVQKGG